MEFLGAILVSRVSQIFFIFVQGLHECLGEAQILLERKVNVDVGCTKLYLGLPFVEYISK